VHYIYQTLPSLRVILKATRAGVGLGLGPRLACIIMLGYRELYAAVGTVYKFSENAKCEQRD